MRVTLSKWGNSLALRVPKDVAELAGFQEGQALELTLDGQSIVISKKRYDIDEMVRDMREKQPPEFDFDDPPRGTEFW
jgi:antitoxin MazE